MNIYYPTTNFMQNAQQNFPQKKISKLFTSSPEKPSGTRETVTVLVEFEDGSTHIENNVTVVW
jgi:hypothetical protein